MGRQGFVELIHLLIACSNVLLSLYTLLLDLFCTLLFEVKMENMFFDPLNWFIVCLSDGINLFIFIIFPKMIHA
ncbi:hypothetical protein VNO78_32848 [Psophocarpus tetragonolobus]|uniref:Uncharacterized protein n=1 Tax=Psophocarpus tetragonolobus TaxID=3891 RepID=A0AAN9NVW7_PSOTE